ncbi:MAG: hypothetical protein UX44_C0005G0013 [candidate division WWE3 bacterium GW2011_GWA1_46_21]|uniref:tRNA threonylcarbamoyladenosine biosynthesis protein TsaE n=3 Tax=Katanobacteria TaxID=422282 RepID=A0A0G1SE05_UNCKA|nr:MAG: hypothetical protein UX44_C0005G0013 [candidate division WWE3 bacterium GW2011_GWA1_46_21]KKU51486.1 MAG: hypothetical protein UX73_C0001G0018 [candidate division WWE3 bacterium GW2011_GWC1_47_10]KKU57857.1 MAG: hypothetical protein UX79_C0004G0013 [candidate division WWE3 bacterium GW2011_GWB1_47_11]
MEILSKSPQDTKELAFRIAGKIKPGQVLALFGDLGSGKTTFVGYLVEGLGIKARVQSPTFVLLRKYGFVNHLDLYRLLNVGDVLDIGFTEIIGSDAVSVIEWPELVEELLPQNCIKIHFEYVNETTRKITIHSLD